MSKAVSWRSTAPRNWAGDGGAARRILQGIRDACRSRTCLGHQTCALDLRCMLAPHGGSLVSCSSAYSFSLLARG